MKLFLMLTVAILSTSAFAENARECNLADTQRAHKEIIRQEILGKKAIYRITRDKYAKQIKFNSPASFESYFENGKTYFYAGSMEYRDMEYNILEGLSFTAQLNSQCRLVSYELFEISPE